MTSDALESLLVPHWEPRSIGREITFEQDVEDWRALARALGELAGDAYARLRRDGLAGRVVSVKLRFAHFGRTAMPRRSLRRRTTPRRCARPPSAARAASRSRRR
jgi:DNA polymerase-4